MTEHPDRFERRFLLYLAAGLLIFICAFITASVFVPMPPQGEKFADRALIFLTGLAGTILGFYWGSSKGSQDKTQTITGIATGASDGRTTGAAH